MTIFIFVDKSGTDARIVRNIGRNTRDLHSEEVF